MKTKEFTLGLTIGFVLGVITMPLYVLALLGTFPK